ncbi:MAG: Fic family protein [Deltaproteobacteria bacterium]|nr:Fic family protein [Deltaproteobacteria bacterium]
MMRTTGTYDRTAVAGEEVAAFVPYPLPPRNPALNMDDENLHLLQAAEEALSRLELAGEMVPSLQWFIYGFVRKEAVVSSQIEGTQATLVDLLEFEAEAVETSKDADVGEVCNYLEALSFARSELATEGGLPLSMRLLAEVHRRLMQGVRGADKLPGETRRSQNWIGGTRPGNAMFVPPPPHALPGLLSAFEKYIHAGDDLPPLVRAGLLHVQFETIHPYLDGNGRIGRLLVTLLLEHWRLLSSPLLYLSLFFKRHRDEYYRRLAAVRGEGDWEGWTRFFLEAVATIASEAVSSAREIFSLITRDRARVLAIQSSTVMAARLFELLPEHPIVTTAGVMELLSTTRPTAAKAITALLDAGIAEETTGKKRGRIFGYIAYLDLLKAGTD